MAEGHELPRGVRGHGPPKLKEYALGCSLVHFETILRNAIAMCALTSSRLDDFSDIVTYILK